MFHRVEHCDYFAKRGGREKRCLDETDLHLYRCHFGETKCDQVEQCDCHGYTWSMVYLSDGKVDGVLRSEIFVTNHDGNNALNYVQSGDMVHKLYAKGCLRVDSMVFNFGSFTKVFEKLVLPLSEDWLTFDEYERSIEIFAALMIQNRRRYINLGCLTHIHSSLLVRFGEDLWCHLCPLPPTSSNEQKENPGVPQVGGVLAKKLKGLHEEYFVLWGHYREVLKEVLPNFYQSCLVKYVGDSRRVNMLHLLTEVEFEDKDKFDDQCFQDVLYLVGYF